MNINNSGKSKVDEYLSKLQIKLKHKNLHLDSNKLLSLINSNYSR